LTIFSLISLSTASADKNLTDEAADVVVSYYAADTMAEQVFAQILAANSIPENVKVLNSLSEEIIIDIQTEEMEQTEGEAYTQVIFECPVNDRKVLFVELAFYAEGYRIIRWTMRDTEEWTPINEIQLHGIR
jgi:hypothetical protein